MRERRIAGGETVYREGDDSDAVYIISDGRVEVTRETAGKPIVLGILGSGQIFGETGVIRDRPRSTTTRALVDTTLIRIDKQDFLEAFGPDNALAFRVLRMLCERLASADRRLAETFHPEGALLSEVGRIRLLPGSPQVQNQIGAEGLVVEELPFRVGRRSQPDEPPLETSMSLAIRAHDTYQMSLEHFSIEEQAGRLVVHDLDSYLGTLVNGERIASFEHTATVGLDFGETDVQAGGADSPYKFKVIVEPA